MPLSPAAVGYCIVGGLTVFSGVKGIPLSDTVKAVLSGNLNVTGTQTIAFGTSDTTANGSGSGTPSTGIIAGGTSTGSEASNQALAKKLATQMGLSSWTQGQNWTDWVKLWNQESGWNTNAKNPTSTAYGIAQFLDSTWATVGGTKTSDPSLQIQYGIKYIQQRYGSPVMAWAHEVANNWY